MPDSPPPPDEQLAPDERLAPDQQPASDERPISRERLTPEDLMPAEEMASLESSGSPESPALTQRDGRWQQVAPQSVTVERIAGWIFAATVLLAGALAIASFVILDRPGSILVGLLLGAYAVAAVGLIWAAHFHPAVKYRHTFYQLSDVGFEIRRGILWRRLITVPHARVQHTDVAQGPLERSFDVGKLIIYTAGTQNASVELGGLAFQTACELRDALIRRRETSDGV